MKREDKIKSTIDDLDNDMSRGIWKAVETKAEKARIAEAKEERKEKTEKTKKKKNNGSTKGSRRVGNLGWGGRGSKIGRESKKLILEQFY